MTSSEYVKLGRTLQEENRKYPNTMTEVPRHKWPSYAGRSEPVAVWRSSGFLAVVYREHDGIMRISVNTTSIHRDGSWFGPISWESLQKIKSEVGYGDREALEVYPRDADVVNVANMRHLWVMPGPLQFGWRK